MVFTNLFINLLTTIDIIDKFYFALNQFPDRYTIHRAIATAFILASKYYLEQCHTFMNSYYAGVFGVSAKELFKLEKTGLTLLTHSLQLDTNTFKYLHMSYAKAYTNSTKLQLWHHRILFPKDNLDTAARIIYKASVYGCEPSAMESQQDALTAFKTSYRQQHKKSWLIELKKSIKISPAGSEAEEDQSDELSWSP